MGGQDVRVRGRRRLQEPLAWSACIHHCQGDPERTACGSGALRGGRHQWLSHPPQVREASVDEQANVDEPQEGPSALPRSLQDALAHHSWHDQAQDCPPPYDKTKKKVIPCCFRITRLRPGRQFCRLGRLATEVGWKYGELVKKLEEKRQIRGTAFHTKKKATLKLKAKAADAVDAKTKAALASFGH